MRVLLHACCGPCLIEPVDALASEHEVTVLYANPNIAPQAEYELRRDTLLTYAAQRNMVVVEMPYDPELWMRTIEAVKEDPASRCRACWALRLDLTASMAAEDGFEAIATTLTVSPYQDPVGVRQAGQAAANAHGVTYLDRDFRDRYSSATARSREAGMYRQNYCGCVFSQAEADGQRAERREARAAAKRDRAAANNAQD